MEMTPDELHRLCAAAALRAGADGNTADSLAAATVRAETRGRRTVGAAHLIDHLHAITAGAVDGTSAPHVTRHGAVVRVDARSGTAQRAVDAALPELLDIVSGHGVGVLAVSRSYTCGELGDYTSRLADHGLVALAAANAPAAVALGQDGSPVIGTNPVSAAAPAGDRMFLVDQAVSQAAQVTVREYADTGRPLPAGWAVDTDGRPTTDASAAGALLPAGGHRTGNIGLVAELLAGLAGGTWSLDAPSFIEGTDCPSTGMLLIVLDPAAFAPVPVVPWAAPAPFRDRLDAHLTRLEQDHGVHVPGRDRGRTSETSLHIDDGVHRVLAGTVD